MKRPKLNPAIIAIHLSSNLVFTGNPENKDNYILSLLYKDIGLTDNQKTVISGKTKKFEILLQNTDSVYVNNALNKHFLYIKLLLKAFLLLIKKTIN